jgi:chemotaxis protein methyltransferase CheR
MSDSFTRRSQEHGFKPQALGLSTTSLILLRDLIEEQTGQYFNESKLDLLADKITDLVAMNGAPSLLDYYYLLKYDTGTDAHWKALLDRLAVPETYFWRQPEQFEALRDVVIPMYLRAGRRSLRIWSAACCTGEEPLTIAMALDDSGLFRQMDIEIIGTDGSEAMVERAKAGVFGNRSMRAISDSMRARYFTPVEKGWRIDPSLHDRVRWGQANLASETDVRPYASANVIFCRNVLIYFSDDAIRNVAATFARLMPTDGYLFLGASESLLRLATDFKMVELGTAFAYTPLANAETLASAPDPVRAVMRDGTARLSERSKV